MKFQEISSSYLNRQRADYAHNITICPHPRILRPSYSPTQSLTLDYDSVNMQLVRTYFLVTLLCKSKQLLAWVPLHKWAKCQKPARNRKNILGQLTVLTYACKTLTNLEYKVHVFTGNGNVENALKTCEITLKQNQRNLFLQYRMINYKNYSYRF